MGVFLLGGSLLAQSDEVPDQTRQDDAVGLSIFWENDGGFTKGIGPTDQYYTSGSGGALQWKSGATSDLVGMIPSIGGEFARGEGRSYSAGFVFALTMFTPKDILDPNIRPDDRPYCGWTYGGLMVQRANRQLGTPAMEHFEIDVGAMGPQSRAEDAQKFIHRKFDQARDPEGWQYQTQNEYGVDFKYVRRWRIGLMSPTREHGPGMDLIPDAGFTAGTIHINATAGATLRYGWNLPDDFGPGRLSRPADFTRPLSRTSGLQSGDISGYFFIRPGIVLVAHDATYGDSFFYDNQVEVDPNPVVGDFTAGVAVMFLRHCQLTYAQNWFTPEFEGQNSWHSIATVMLSLVYTR